MSIARAILLTLAAGLAWAQGTVVFSGRITDAATGQPIEDAAIILEQGNSHASQLSDAAGNSSFEEDIVAGAARIQIQKEGYILFQRSNPDESSVQITGDHSEHNFKLTPAGSITGRISGEDAEKLVVTLLREDFTGGVARFIAVASTNSSYGIGLDGSFGFVGLEPGRYVVSASPRPGGLLTMSTILCLEGNCSALRKEVEQAADAPTEGYVTTYYPGTTKFADALPVTLASGEKRAMDFRIAKRPLFRVSGEIEVPDIERASPPVISAPQNLLGPLGADGTADMAQPSRPVSLVFRRTDGGWGESASRSLVSIPGPFAVSGLPAGQYTGTAFGMQGNDERR